MIPGSRTLVIALVKKSPASASCSAVSSSSCCVSSAGDVAEAAVRLERPILLKAEVR
jgi:hypothetical protein